MTQLHELMDVDLLDEMVKTGMVRAQTQLELGLSIYNYTAAAQYSRTWNDVTEQCRGLIVNEYDEVVARPFRKFYNYGEWEGRTLPSGPIEVTDKADGSLGILYEESTGPGGSKYAIATRGSFASEQSIWATKWLEGAYPDFTPRTGVTYLFEIVYPQNRIVLDYGDWEGLILLARIDTATGRTLDGVGRWPGRVVTSYPYTSMEEVLAAPQEPNREGFVVRFKDSDTRIKFKFDEYVRLHRIVTGVSSKTVWELLSSGKPLDEIIEHVPDEFYDWVEKTADELTTAYRTVVDEANTAYAQVLFDAQRDPEYAVSPRSARKTYARYAQPYGKLRPALFSLLDGRDIGTWAWNQIEPKFSKPFSTQSEDVA